MSNQVKNVQFCHFQRQLSFSERGKPNRPLIACKQYLHVNDDTHQCMVITELR